LRTLGKASPNLLSNYPSTPSGSMGLVFTTARTPSSVFTAHAWLNARVSKLVQPFGKIVTWYFYGPPTHP
jgi:hypothetical protein